MTQAMLAGIPVPLLAAERPAVEFAKGDCLGYLGDPSLGDEIP